MYSSRNVFFTIGLAIAASPYSLPSRSPALHLQVRTGGLLSSQI